ncbi:hypothetical protein TWF106_001642 [Orbilia oligospora]|uniref:Uncharacterized protein n=1 Tax=Orbilia oligospora TaxID=2813651 RepID=A0A7C8QAV8_ORBOL|nr:hypothetical protein TWF106_001642 [Orbilia oligospora]
MKPTRTAICGFGLRGRLFHNIYIASQLSLLWRGKPIDKSPRHHDYFELQPSTEGLGTSFQLGSDAALNTALDPPIASINKEGLSTEQIRVIDRLTDLAGRYAEIAMEDETIMPRLLESNVAAAMIFHSSSSSRTGKLNTDVACGPRSLVGEVAELMTEEALKLAKEYLPWLSISVRYEVVVSNIDFSNPAFPVLTVVDVKTGEELTGLDFVYNLVIKCTGTTFEIPVSGEVKENAFTGIPNSIDLTTYLTQQGMMFDNDEKKIIPGKKLLIGGTSLSAFDFIGMIVTKTNIVEFNHKTRTFTINEEEARRNQNLITLFNRTEGIIGTSRHLPNSVTNLDCDLVNPEMILSLGLQKNADTYPSILELARILTAYKKQKLPSQIEKNISTIDQIEYMAAENELLAKNPDAVTEIALFRKWIRCCIFTHTMGPDQVQQRAWLERKYNHLVRSHGWLNFRTMSYNICHRPEIEEREHKLHCHARRIAFNCIAASPFEIHTLITRLYKLGVVSWIQGAYEDVIWSSKTKKFELKGYQVDGLIAPRRLTQKTDMLSEKILKQAKRLRVGEPRYEKGRFLKNSSGEYLHLIDLGYTGHGIQWYDTNAAEGAFQLMPIVVDMAVILETLMSNATSKGGEFEKPVNELLKLHKAVLPTNQEFNEQINRMEEPHRNITHMILYARLVEKVFGNGKSFAQKMRQGGTIEARERVIALIADMPRASVQEALKEFERDWQNYKFKPVNAQEFERMTPDFSLEHMQAVKRIFEQRCHQGNHVPHLP